MRREQLGIGLGIPSAEVAAAHEDGLPCITYGAIDGADVSRPLTIEQLINKKAGVVSSKCVCQFGADEPEPEPATDDVNELQIRQKVRYLDHGIEIASGRHRASAALGAPVGESASQDRV